MIYLYMDNFRGFQRTFLPIQDVNFFVGENSTGKTSILGLIRLFSSPQFWFYQKFSIEDVEFGHFNDVVSVNAKDRSYFNVGLIQIAQHADKPGFSAFLLSFKEKEGQPRLTKFAFTAGKHEIQLNFEKKNVRYRTKVLKQIDNYDDFLKEVFNPWIDLPDIIDDSYRGLPKELSGIFSESEIALWPLVIMVVGQIEKDDKKHKLQMEIQQLAFGRDIVWLAPIRTKPRRTYDEYKMDFSPEGIHTPYLIKKILAQKKGEAEKFKRFLETVGRSSGLFETIEIKRYGKGATSPFELDIVLKKHALSIGNVGYGVSQSLPVIVEIFARPHNSWFAIQQPEVHLHPKAQAALGDILFELAVQERKKFIVETHSDFMIDRFRLNYRKKGSKKPNAQVLFFERTESGNRVFNLPISDEGNLPIDQPSTYREFFIREQMDLVSL